MLQLAYCPPIHLLRWGCTSNTLLWSIYPWIEHEPCSLENTKTRQLLLLSVKQQHELLQG
jgi:hypothetical protein